MKYSVRFLLRDPGFAAIVVLTLALGIGGNTAILGAVRTILFAPLPFPQSDQLVRLRATTTGPTGDQNAFNLRAGEIQAIEQLGDSSPFVSTLALSVQNRTLTGGDSAEQVSVSIFHGEWNSVLGIAPIMGRWFSVEEEKRGDQSGTVVIAASLWKRRFGGDPNILGKAMSLDHGIRTIVGVLPEGFRFPYLAEVWTPATMDMRAADDYAVFGRLKSGISIVAASQALTGVPQSLARLYPKIYSPGTGIRLWHMHESFIEDHDRAAALLAAAGGFFLLLATFNVASLVLARSVTRRHELQTRAALGARRWHLVRRSLAETLVLSLAGGGLGVILAAEAVPYLNDLLPPVLTRQLNMITTGGWFSASVALALSVFIGIAAGVFPAIVSASINVDGVARTSGRIGRNRRERVWMDGFVALEFTLALALTTGAGLMLRNLNLLTHRDLGIDTTHLLAVHVSTTDPRYAGAGARRNLVEEVVRAAGSAPGVAMAGVSTVNPLGGTTWTAPIAVEGHEITDAASSFTANHRLVTPRAMEANGDSPAPWPMVHRTGRSGGAQRCHREPENGAEILVQR